MLAIGGGIGIDITYPPFHGPRTVTRVIRRRVEGNAVERGLVLRQAGCPGQRQDPGRCVVAPGNAALVGEIEAITGNQATLDRDNGLIDLGIIHISQGQCRLKCNRRSIFGIAAHTASASNRRHIIHR